MVEPAEGVLSVPTSEVVKLVVVDWAASVWVSLGDMVDSNQAVVIEDEDASVTLPIISLDQWTIQVEQLTSTNEGTMLLSEADLVRGFTQRSHTSLDNAVTDAVVEWARVLTDTQDVTGCATNATSIGENVVDTRSLQR